MMLGYLEMNFTGSSRDLGFFFGVTASVLIFFKALSWLYSATKKACHRNYRTATGVDAAEKGDTRRLLLEKIPYDLQKRAILHKASGLNRVSHTEDDLLIQILSGG